MTRSGSCPPVKQWQQLQYSVRYQQVLPILIPPTTGNLRRTASLPHYYCDSQ